jgi:hypothetical protein
MHRKSGLLKRTPVCHLNLKKLILRKMIIKFIEIFGNLKIN